MRVHRQKDHPHAIFAGSRQVDSQGSAFALKKRVRNLDQDARAVAGLWIAATGAAMREINQDLDALQDDVVRFATFDAGDKANAAAIVLIFRAVKALRRRQTAKWIFHIHGLNVSNITPTKSCKASRLFLRYYCTRPRVDDAASGSSDFLGAK